MNSHPAHLGSGWMAVNSLNCRHRLCRRQKRAYSRQFHKKRYANMKKYRKNINRTKILERDLYICAYCYGNATEVDHVVPYKWIPDDDEDNLVASCLDCNRIAGDKMFSSFDEKRAFIQTLRNGKKWTRKLAIKFQVFRCSNCKKIFIPLENGATNFLCPGCTRKEYGKDKFGSI